MDKDIVNIIRHLYFKEKIADEESKQVLHCYWDTVQPLQRSQTIDVTDGEWRLAPGVLGFLKLAEASLANFPPKDWLFSSPFQDPLSKPPRKLKCFVAMPYGPRWFRQVRNALEQAAKNSGYIFDIAADISRPGNIVHQVWESIRSADVVVADLTGLNPNVMYEVGIAHALGKQVLLITQKKKDLPFDVRAMRWHAYSLKALVRLNTILKESLEEVRKEIALPVVSAH